MTLRPHSAAIQSDLETFLSESSSSIAHFELELRTSAAFKSIFKATLAVDCVLAKMSSSKMNPRLTVARAAIRRIPTLLSVGQVVPVYGELRRFLELVGWTIYFSSHEVEWQTFEREPTASRTNDLSKPIAYCAFRDRLFFSNYAIELLEQEPSGIAQERAQELSRHFLALNPYVHATSLATAVSLRPSVDSIEEDSLRSLSTLHKKIASDSLIVLAAVFADRFSKLPPMHRGWFDWLIGSGKSKRIRSGPFGLLG